MFKNEHFSSPIYYDDKPEWVDKLDNLCDPYIKTARSQHQVQDEVGAVYHSDNLYKDSEFNFFHEYVLNKSHWLLDDMGYDVNHYNLIFTESWVQEFSFNGCGHHWFHTHSNNHVSGFYFLKSSSKTSKPMFQDPRVAHAALKLKEKDESTLTNSNDLVNYESRSGRFIFFPAYLSHSYMVDHGIEPFRFIHFNIKAVEKQT